VLAGPFSLIDLVCNTLFNLPSQERQVDASATSRRSWARAGCSSSSATSRTWPGFDRGQWVATRALTEDSVEMEFVTDDPVASAVSYQRVTFGARALRCGRYGCAAAGRVSWT